MRSKILLCLVLLCTSISAFAFDPKSSHDVVIYFSGASAADKLMFNAINNQVCTSGTQDYLEVTQSSSGSFVTNSNHWGISCSTSTLGTTPSTIKLLFIKRSAGGSAYGVQPLVQAAKVSGKTITYVDATSGVRGSTIPFLDVTKCTNTTGTKLWVCNSGTSTAAVIPDAGLSDVDPLMFQGSGINEPPDFNSVTATQTKLLSINGAVAQGFGVVVNDRLYKALQEAQFGLSSLCVGNITEACMPSISKLQLATIFSGKVKSWNDIVINGKSIKDPTITSDNITADNKVHICRREGGSGTQATLNATILDAPCTVAYGSAAPAFSLTSKKKPIVTQYPGAVGSNPSTGPVVIETLSSGVNEACLDDFDKGTNNSTFNSTNTTAWAIGWLGTEKNASHTKNYRFIKIDGNAPTLENIWSGRYPYWGELTFQWRTEMATWASSLFVDGANKTASKSANSGSNKVKVVSAIRTLVLQPSSIASLNSSNKHSWGQGGYLITTASNPNLNPEPSASKLISNPVLNYSHTLTSSTTVQGCRVPTIFKPQSISLF